jgi:hypothetical protein
MIQLVVSEVLYTLSSNGIPIKLVTLIKMCLNQMYNKKHRWNICLVDL